MNLFENLKEYRESSYRQGAGYIPKTEKEKSLDKEIQSKLDKYGFYDVELLFTGNDARVIDAVVITDDDENDLYRMDVSKFSDDKIERESQIDKFISMIEDSYNCYVDELEDEEYYDESI